MVTLSSALNNPSSMVPPHYRRIRQDKTQGETGTYSFGPRIHARPEFYKYYFYVFTEDSPQQGQTFLNNKANRLCIAHYAERQQEISETGDLAYVYRYQFPRRGDATPFVESHPKWKDAEWATPLDEDPDSPYLIDGLEYR